MPAVTTKGQFKLSAVEGKTELEIIGEIGDWGTTAKDFRDVMKRIGKAEDFNLHIVSGGGSIFEGNEIANTIKKHKGSVTVTLGSICGSIATVIACAGDKVIAAKNTIYMIHDPSAFTMGNSEDHRKSAEIMDKLKSGIVAAYMEKTGKDSTELEAMMTAETWMTSDEAEEAGFVDEVDDAEAEDEEIENFDHSKFKNFAAFKAAHKTEPAPQPVFQNSAPNTNMTKTAEEIAAEKVSLDKAISEGIKARMETRNARDKEVRAAVTLIAKRDGKNAQPIADDILNSDDKTASDFYAAYARAEKLEPSKPVIGSGPEFGGSGIQVIEPMDRMRGTPGYQFIMAAPVQELFTSLQNSPRREFRLAINVPSDFRNATQTTSSPNQLTSIEYKPGVSQLGLRVLRVKQLIPGGATSAMTIRGRREDAFTDDASSVSEVGTLANLSFSVAEVDYPVTDVGGYVEVSENFMSDQLAAMSLLNQRLPYKVERRTDYLLLNGVGAGADMVGILGTGGIQTQALAGDTRADAIHKGKTKVETVPNAVQANAGGGYTPDAMIIHPTDWETLELQKDLNGQYLMGGPFRGPYGQGEFANVGSYWGLPAVRTTAITQGTALIGAFQECSQWFQRQGLVIEMTNSNGTNFLNRIVTFRATERLALTVDQPNGFCQVTGL